MKKILVLMSLILVLAMSGTALAAIGGHVIVVPPANDSQPEVDILSIDIAAEALKLATDVRDALQSGATVTLGKVELGDSNKQINQGQLIQFVREQFSVSAGEAQRLVKTIILPVLKATLEDVVTRSFAAAATDYSYAVEVSGDQLATLALKDGEKVDPAKIDLYLKKADGKLDRIDGWTLRDAKGVIATSIESGKPYYIVAPFKDNEWYDLNTTDTGVIEVSPVLVNASDAPAGSGGSSGCDAGLPLTAVAAALGGLLFIKRR